MNQIIDFHPTITNKLNFFLKTEKIPNIIFHGQSGSGKRTIVNNFVSSIYHGNKELMKAYVMNVNCAHGKGIKFVREELKFFAKTHINIKGSGHFKTVILSNADKLTIDAQSALRRCIELFSHTTRFFIIVENKYKLLKPILSRLCEIFVAETIIDGKRMNLHRYGIQKNFNTDSYDKKRDGWFTKTLNTFLLDTKNDTDEAKNKFDYNNLLNLSVQLYEKGYSGLDLMDYLEKYNDFDIEPKRKYHMLLTFHKVKKEFRNEKLLMLFILNFVFLRSELDLENISFM
jgi:hypothetical protein